MRGNWRDGTRRKKGGEREEERILEVKEKVMWENGRSMVKSERMDRVNGMTVKAELEGKKTEER